MCKIRHTFLVLLAGSVLLFSIAALGQVLKGSISGTATDPQGAVVSNATVTATHLQTGTAFNTTTDNAGLFRFNLIPAGDYKIEISAPGFSSAVQNNVSVTPGKDTGMGSIKLAVGQASTTIEVVSAAPLVESTQSQVTNTFTGTALTTFSGVQENEGLDNMALFVPGVVATRDNNFSNTNGIGFSSNGLRGRNNDQEIDGQNNNDNSVAGPSLFLSDSEFVDQYVLVTNQFGPEYGRNSGSVVNIITKSGTNDWHGSIYATENNSVVNSLTNVQKRFQGLTEVPRANDEFGGFTVGGPIVRNKAFIFGGFSQEIVSQNTVYSSSSLTPTPAGLTTLAACFPGSASLSALNKFGPYGISGGNPTPVNPTVPLGTVQGCPGVEFGGVTRTLATPAHTFNWIMRADLQLANDTLSGRYIFNRNNFFNLDDNAAAGYPFNNPGLSQATLASWTHNFSPHIVNEARVAFDRANFEFGGNNIGNTEATASNLSNAVTNVIFRTPGLLGYGPATNLPQSRIVNTWQGQDNLNWVLGKHQIHAGVNFTYQRSPNTFLPNLNGQFRFNDWTSYFLNAPNRVRVAQGTPVLDFREYDTFLYFGDDWKVSQSFTLNLGITWSYYGQPANLFNDITSKRESNPATAFWNPAAPASARIFPSIPAPSLNFGPSVGFAYSPNWGGALTGNGKTVIRGGYRFLYDPPFYNIYLNIASSAPQVFLQSLTGPSAALIPLPAVPTGPNVRAAAAPLITPGVFDPRTQNLTSITPDFGPDKVNAWSLGIQREVTKNSAVELRYSGNHAYNLFQSLNGNPFVGDLQRDFPNLVPSNITPCAATTQIGPGAGTDVGRVNCGNGIERIRTNTGYSNYHALQSEFRANNMFKQLTIRAAYTFSKTMDNVSEIFGTGAAGNTVAFPQNALDAGRGEYSQSGLDFPHQGSILFTEQLPFYRDQHGAMGRLLGGWALSGNYILASGQRYTPSQLFSAFSTAAGDYYDINFIGAFAGTDVARPFLGNSHAPVTSVGIFAGDACALFVAPGAADPVCALAPTQLVSMNALGQSCASSFSPTPTCAAVPVTNNNVRFIINGGTAQTVFGTPFGNARRNIVQDAITNIANFSVYKNIKFSERNSLTLHITALNVFNHPNFQTVDPFLEDAGQAGFSQGTPVGFGDPTLSNTVIGNGLGTRRWIAGAKFTF